MSQATSTDQPAASSPPAAEPPAPETAKDTVISIVIAFALAFVFRGFVIEAFVIPTGSMAPTLMGAHMKFRSSESGYAWSVDPWHQGPQSDPAHYPSPQTNIAVNDPMNGQEIRAARVPLHAGDRILVLKYLYTVAEPQRWDVIVFKNPTDPSVNYIKRLIGLPGEEVALVDGDVFVRPTTVGKPGLTGAVGWAEQGWTIARKPLISQRAVWQPIFDAGYSPANAANDRTPFVPSDPAGWNVTGRAYTYDRSSRTELIFDEGRKRFTEPVPERWLLDDRYAYDQKGRTPQPRFPVSDLRLRAGIEPKGPGLKVEARLDARAHEFGATIDGGVVTLWMRPSGPSGGAPAATRELGRGTITPLAPGRVTNIEFWHVDQTLEVWIDGALAVRGSYEWSPAERLLFTTRLQVSEVSSRQANERVNILADPSIYRRPTIRWAFEGAPVTLHCAAIDRDLYYQPATYRTGGPAIATNPRHPLRLEADQFFACGDNSPASLDGRLWEGVDPWIDRAFGPPAGIVPRDLLLGRAFFVYWPSLRYDAAIPVPDFGRMRFIW